MPAAPCPPALPNPLPTRPAHPTTQDGRLAESFVDPLPPALPPPAAGGADAAAGPGPGAAALLALAVSPRKASVVQAAAGAEAEAEAGAEWDAGALGTSLAAGQQERLRWAAAELAGGAGLASTAEGPAWPQGPDTAQPTQAGSDWFVQCPTVVPFRSFAGAAAGALGEGASDGSSLQLQLGPDTLGGVGVGIGIGMQMGEGGAGAAGVTGGPEGEAGSLTQLRAWEGPVPGLADGTAGGAAAQGQQRQQQQEGGQAEGH